jgi:hypothetical protein
VAALAPSERVAWIAALEAGPDDRPIREQLVEHGKVISAYFQELHAGLSILQPAGVKPGRRGRKGESPAAQALNALTAWLRRAQAHGRLAKCDVDTLAATILGALHGWALTARLCGQSTTAAAGERHVERFIDLLWTGIGGGKSLSD